MKNLKIKKPNIDLLKYTACFFAFVVLYNFLIINKCHLWSVDMITYTFHLVDFSFGFASKLLPGAIYHLFFKEVYSEQLNIYLTALMLVLFAFVAFCLAKLILSRKSAQSRKTLCVLSLFFLSGPCTFAVFTDELGMLDTYWLFFSALFLILVANKYLKFALPLIFVLSLLVHFSFIFCYFIFFSLILLYRIVCEKDKKERISLIIVFALGILAVAALGLFLLLKEQDNLVYTMQAFNKELDARNRFTNNTYYVYYDYAFYKHYEIGSASFAGIMKQPLIQGDSLIASLINPIYFQLRMMYASYLEEPKRFAQLAGLVLLLCPLCVISFRYWIKKMKTARKAQKAVYWLMLLQFPITLVFCLCFSPDVSRWLSHAFLIQFALFFYVIYHQKEELEIKIEKNRVLKGILIGVYFVVYAFTYINPF
ncbi:MAG: hypothetical protein IKE65_05875 [Clostridia bacterium]|nr:hypothetical protein [Clostridia bacterium]